MDGKVGYFMKFTEIFSIALFSGFLASPFEHFKLKENLANAQKNKNLKAVSSDSKKERGPPLKLL